jgi:hypothetical protein
MVPSPGLAKLEVGIVSRHLSAIRVVILGILAAGILTLLGLLFSGPASAGPPVPCSDYWVGGQSGAGGPQDWNNSFNWAPNADGSGVGVVPGPDDVVCMATDPATTEVQVQSGENDTADLVYFPASGSEVPFLYVSPGGGGGTLTLGPDPSTVDNFENSDGSLIGVGGTPVEFTVDGVGTLTESGAFDNIQYEAAGTTSVPSAAQNFELAQNSVLEVPAGGNLTIGDSGYIYTDGSTGAAVTLDQGGTIDYDATASGHQGTIDAAFNDNGTVSATTGQLLLSDNGTLGPDAVASGITGGQVVVYNGSDFTAGTTAGTTGSINGLYLETGGGIGPGDFTLSGGASATFDDASGVEDTGLLSVASGTTLVMQTDEPESMSGGSEIDNSGTIDFEVSSTLNCDESSDQVVNEPGGVIELPATSRGQIADIQCTVIDNGTLEATFGTLDLDQMTVFGSTANATSQSGGELLLTSSGTAYPPAEIGGSPQTGSISGLTLADGSTLDGPGTLENDVSGASVNFEGPFVSAGVVVSNGPGETLYLDQGTVTVVDGGSQVVNYGDITMDDSSTLADGDDAGSQFINKSTGVVTYQGSFANLTASINLITTNLGTIKALYGILNVNLSAGNLPLDGVLTGGNYDVSNAELDIPNVGAIAGGGTEYEQAPDILADDATIDIGPNGTMETGSGPLTSLTSVQSGAVLTTSGNLELSGSLGSSGTITVSGGTLTADTGIYLNGDSTTSVAAGATLTSGSSGSGGITLAPPSGAASAPTLTGSGTVEGVIDNEGGDVSPSLLGAALTVNGSSASYNQTPAEGGSPALSVTIASSGTTAGTNFSQLAVDGPATLGGALDITSTGYVPTAGDSFTILTATSVTGHFATINGTAIASSGLAFAISYTATSVVLTTSSIAVTGVSPNPIGQGASGVAVTITGLGFGSSDTVTGASGVTFSNVVEVNYETLTADVTVTPTAATGAGMVSVTPSGGSAITCASCFTVDAAAKISKFSVAAVARPATNTSVTVTGTGFSSSPSTLSVSFSGPGTAVTGRISGTVSATSFTMLVTVPTTAATGEYSVTVHNGDYGVGGCTSCLKVEVIPTVTSLTPAKFGQGASGVAVTILGNYFATGATVTCSNTGVSFSSVVVKSATEITAKVTVKSTAGIGPATVTVSDPGQGSGAKTSALTVDAAPHPTSLSPNSEKQGTTSAVVDVRGTGFVSKDTVKFSGSGVTDVYVANVGTTEIELKVTVSKTAAITKYSVTVVNPDGGTATCANCFSVAKAAAPNKPAVPKAPVRSELAGQHRPALSAALLGTRWSGYHLPGSPAANRAGVTRSRRE